jgi:endonuclease YncB( thermonuclease family)
LAWGKRRPLWRTAIDAIVFIVLLAIVLTGLELTDVLEINTGNAKAKDGDSLVVAGQDIRLHGIDAPELKQTCGSPDGEYECGRMARDELRKLIRSQTISCRTLEVDRYQRQVAVCKTGEMEINREMVRLGWAIAYFRHSTAYAREQKEAKAARRGIWRGRFEMPENYRNRTRPITGDMSGTDLGE